MKKIIMIKYTLTRSNRKSVALYVRNGNVEVRAPLRMPKRDIDSFVALKEAWITNRLAKSREQSERRGAFALMKLFRDVCGKRGITCDNGVIFNYMHAFPAVESDQLSLF